MTPEMQAAVARLRSLFFDLVETGEEESVEDAQSLALVLAAVTPREGAEIEDRIGAVFAMPPGDRFRLAVHEGATEQSERFAVVFGATEAEALARARAVAQVAAREVEP